MFAAVVSHVGIYDMLRQPEKSQGQIFNLGNPTEFTLNELAKTVLRITGSKSEVVHEALPVDDPQVRQPDITRARDLLGWEPKVGLEDGLRRTIELAGVEQLAGAAE